MNATLLSRVVRLSKKGLFVFYGGWRYRPQTKTLAKEGDIIILESPFGRYDEFAIVYIEGKKEVWKQTTKLAEHKRGRQKRIRFTSRFIWGSIPEDYATLIKC